jgi:hypothetical protein
MVSMSLNNENNCREISEDKIAVCEKNCGSTERELFGIELGMFESVSSHRGHSKRPIG